MPPSEPPGLSLHAFFRINPILVGLAAGGLEGITEPDRLVAKDDCVSSVILPRPSLVKTGSPGW
jgi:hypothetical protein